MKLILPLSFMLLFTQMVSADEACKDDGNAGICVTVKSSELNCNQSAGSDYLSSCVANIAYQLTNHSDHDAEVKVSCKVELNYLKSVMGIRDTGKQRNTQNHALIANSDERFEMPVEFKFATQTEANNAEIKAVNCRID